MSHLTAGTRVTVKGKEAEFGPGTVRFCGEVKFGPGIWVGIELDEPRGRNDGFVKGERYFTCAPNFGIILKETLVEVLAQPVASKQLDNSAVSAPVPAAAPTPTPAPSVVSEPAPVPISSSSPVDSPVVATSSSAPAPAPASTATTASSIATVPTISTSSNSTAATSATSAQQAAPSSAPGTPLTRPPGPVQTTSTAVDRSPAIARAVPQGPSTPVSASTRVAVSTPVRPSTPTAPLRQPSFRDEGATGEDTPTKSKEAALTVQLATLVKVQTAKLRNLLANAQGRPEDYKKYLDDMVKANEEIEREVKRVRLRNVELERRSVQLESDVLTATKQLHDVLIGNLTVEEQANQIKSQAGSYAQQLQLQKSQTDQQARTLQEAQRQIDALREEIAQSKQQQSAEVLRLQQEAAALQNQLQGAQEALALEQHQHSQALASLAEKHSAELNQARSSSSTQITELTQQHQNQLAEANHTWEDRLTASVSSYQAELTAIKRSVLARRAELESAVAQRAALTAQLMTVDQFTNSLISGLNVSLSFEAPEQTVTDAVQQEVAAPSDSSSGQIEPSVQEAEVKINHVSLAQLDLVDEQPIDPADEFASHSQPIPAVANPDELTGEEKNSSSVIEL